MDRTGIKMNTLRKKINAIPALLLLAIIAFCSVYVGAQATGAWTPGTPGASDLGSTSTWFQDIYFGHATGAGLSMKLLATPTAARTMTIPDNSFTINTDNVIDAVGATILTPAQSGSLILFDSGTGFTVTLPTPAVGLKYDFVTKTSATTDEILTKTTTTDFISGTPFLTITASTSNSFTCVPTTAVSLRFNGTTTGGLQGSWIQLRAVSSTLWEAHGILVGSGTLATPCLSS